MGVDSQWLFIIRKTYCTTLCLDHASSSTWRDIYILLQLSNSIWFLPYQDQASEKYGQWAKSTPPHPTPSFVNTVLPEVSPAHLVMLLIAVQPLQSRVQYWRPKPHGPQKLKYFYYLTLWRKFLPTLDGGKVSSSLCCLSCLQKSCFNIPWAVV